MSSGGTPHGGFSHFLTTEEGKEYIEKNPELKAHLAKIKKNAKKDASEDEKTSS